MHSGRPWRLGHRPALDGLRGVAILLVMLGHFFETTWMHVAPLHAIGAAGVSLFFALSGFLITSLLLKEADHGRISLRRFYRNRALRLIPAAVVAIAALTIIETWLRPRSQDGLVYVLTYSANWATVSGHPLFLLAPMWSLAIEEQFYLLWPLVVVLLIRRRPRWLPIVTIVGIVASWASRFTSTGEHTYYGSDTNAAGLLLGCLLAQLAVRGLPPRLARSWFVPIGLVALASVVLVSSFRVGDLWVPALVPLVGVVLIWAGCSLPGTVLEAASLRYLGSRSYALYLWHFGILYAATHVVGSRWVAGTVGLVVVFGLAEASRRYIELPFLRRKSSAGWFEQPCPTPQRSAPRFGLRTGLSHRAQPHRSHQGSPDCLGPRPVRR